MNLLLPKPEYRKQRERRKRELKRKDRDLQIWASKQMCSVEGCANRAEGHHKIPRRYLKIRHDKSNILTICRYHHRLLHDGHLTFLI